ncbi:glycosyltransferase family 2 protein [Anaerostipes hadrus]|uniref:glycosyltransferase family 2 protein n=1 Tax=Anaerostipes hadrus TaxID=649756 RepID=UPI001ADDCA86|nr:glycosyltransferase family 2 protein [Anaerostipes hadrus]MBP0051145.1 glycosyltransferase family 2 protein [Anaerostipes hadrus]MBP0054563.1 glycosyltransferase family 2 protein [Anaerostipes hadrus]
METNKKVSIVIPVYKAEDTITRCVESLEKNTYKNLQIILVEDCSGDQTINVCKELANTYDNVLCIENDRNHGVSYTRNHGLDYADGTYLMFVDSDDYVEVDYVETMISAISCADDKNVMPICGYVNHDEKKNGRTDIFLPSNESEYLKKSIQIMPELYENRMLQIIWNKIFRLDVIKQNHIRFKEEMFIGEDFRFLLEYMKAAKISGFLFVNKVLCHYMRDNENSLMSRLLETKIQDSLDNFEIMYELMGKSLDEIQKLLREEKEKQLEYYAYTIMHDTNMTMKEKKEKIMQLPSENVKDIYIGQKCLYKKEKLYLCIKKVLKKK